MTRPAAQNQLARILENHLDDLVAVAHEHGLRRFLPLFDVAERLGSWSGRRRRLGEVEGERLELAVAVEVGFKVLQQYHFLVDGGRIIEKVVVRDELPRSFLLVFGFSFRLLVLVAFHVVKVE